MVLYILDHETLVRFLKLFIMLLLGWTLDSDELGPFYGRMICRKTEKAYLAFCHAILCRYKYKEVQ